METEREPLDELAEAVLEGHRVDWASAASSPGAPTPEVVHQLKVLAGIAELHRKLTRDTPVSERHKVPEGRLERWGRLEILERIGHGSFGEVYRAWDPKLDREVAVKLLHESRTQPSPTGARRVGSSERATEGPEGATVLEEARLLARVRHPNVVTVYDADEIDGRVGLWMEFIHGRTLEQVLGERKKFDDREVTRVGIELCRALAAVHDAGLLHRDIKAQNLMQAGDGRLVLMDFGTGRELEETETSGVDAAGTPLYLAPEIFGGAQATVRADIYSAGVVLFHLLTGAYPVRGATVKEVGEAHARGERLDLSARAPGVNKALAATIGRAIEPDPSKRFESARAMLAALENVRRKSEARKAKRYSLALGAVVLAALALTVVPGLVRSNQSRDPKSPAGRAAYFGSTAEKRAVQRPQYMIPGTPSPDGRFLPYSDLTGNVALYEFATGVSRTLTSGGDGGDVNFATESIVSSDSSRVATSWADSSCDCWQLRIVDVEATTVRVLYGERGVPEILPLQWSADDSQILGTRKASSGEIDVVLVSTLDGDVRTIRTLAYRGMVTLSPDGRFIAYDRAEDSDDTDRGIFLAATDGDREIPIVTGATYDTHPLWTPDGSGLVFASHRTGGPGLWLQPIEGGKADGPPRLLDKDMGPFAPHTLTRRGSLFYDHRTGLMDVYTAPIDPATGDVIGEPTNAANRFLGSNIYADWSPDGDSLVFASWRTLFGPGRNILVFHSMRTGQEREFELDVGVGHGVRWSPDGRFVAVGGPDRKGVRALRLIDPESGRIVSEANAAYGSLAWDADARHAYIRHDTWQISRIDVSTAERELVYQPPKKSIPGAIALSPDGRWLAHTIAMQTTKSAQLIVIPTEGGDPRTLVDLPGAPVALGLGGWTRDGRQILFVRTAPDSEQYHVGELWAVPFEGGPPRSLGLSMRALRDVRVSPDGTRISFTSGYPDRELWVFENFLPPTLTGPPPRAENPLKDLAAQTRK